MTKKQEFINLLIWTVIFVVISYFINPIIFSEKVSPIISISISLVGTILLIGFIVSWVKFFKKR